MAKNKKIKKLISIICPVYNEEEAIPLFYKKLMNAIADLKKEYNFELIFTNNCSEDSTLQKIKKIISKDKNVHVITLSRNFGYQCSLLSGLNHVMGAATIVIDVDCEDPPEMIPGFIKEWEKGYDIVYGKRDRRPEPFFIQWMRKLFYRLTKIIADYDFILDMAEFSLFTDRVRKAILQNQSTFPFIRSDIGYIGFKRYGISYGREKRIIGKSHYKFLGMVKFSVGGILSSSTFPLRLSLYFGIPLFLINLVSGIIYIYTGIVKIFLLLFLVDFCYIILILSFLSLYIARIHKNIVKRPLFIIDWENSILNNDARKQ